MQLFSKFDLFKQILRIFILFALVYNIKCNFYISQGKNDRCTF